MLERLIAEGEHVRQTCTKRLELGTYVTGENYVKWISKSILFLEKTYPNRTLTKTFIQESLTAIGYGGSERLNAMTGILKGIREFESESE